MVRWSASNFSSTIDIDDIDDLIAWDFQNSKTFLPTSASARSADISIGIRILASGDSIIIGGNP